MIDENDPLGVGEDRQTLLSMAKRIGLFDQVDGHETDNGPRRGLAFQLMLGQIDTITSGLAATSARVIHTARILTPFDREPKDEIDRDIGVAAGVFIGQVLGSFRLEDEDDEDDEDAGRVRTVDARGTHGVSVRAVPGYWEHPDTRVLYRLADITVPVLVNDCWPEVP